MTDDYILNEGVSNCCNADVLENTERCSACQENCVVIKPIDTDYNPDKELSADDIKKLSEEDFMKYLDSKSAYLKQFAAKELPNYHKKMFRTMNELQTGNTIAIDKASNIITQATRI